MTAAMQRVAFQLASLLEAALPADEKLPAAELLERGAKLTRSEEIAPYMKLSMEIVAKAGRGEAPYGDIAGAFVDGFMVWVEARLDTEDLNQRRAEAALILTLIDGLAVVSLGVEAADLDAAISIAVTKFKAAL
ncbi:MAG: hypothetical protein HKP25_13350 [Marinicaulis sp.]|nr:hypothetical protein [Marinicaulis sp.]